MRYISDDGKVFNTAEDCKAYEKRIADEKLRKEKLLKDKNDRFDSIMKHRDNLLDEIKMYKNDYGEDVNLTNGITIDDYTRMLLRLLGM